MGGRTISRQVLWWPLSGDYRRFGNSLTKVEIRLGLARTPFKYTYSILQSQRICAAGWSFGFAGFGFYCFWVLLMLKILVPVLPLGLTLIGDVNLGKLPVSIFRRSLLWIAIGNGASWSDMKRSYCWDLARF
jgi:hypothetical protein